MYERVVADEEAFKLQQLQQVEEGELLVLVENYRIESETSDCDTVDKNRARLLHSSATLIQRTWRDFKRSQQQIVEHLCCPCNTDYPAVFEYYQTTDTVCFCCDEHRTHGYLDEELQLEQLGDNLTSEMSLNIDFPGTSPDSKRTTMTGITTDLSSVPQHVPKTVVVLDEAQEKVDRSVCVGDEKVYEDMSTEELRGLVKNLEFDIQCANIALVTELMTRDQLNTQHETLLIEVDILVKGSH